MKEPATPYRAEELSAVLSALGVPPRARVAVAVSGGADSLCLSLLAHQVADVRCVTFNHGLRPASAGEAARVGAQLAKAGVPHTVLRWDSDKPSANIQAAARQARYDSLGAWCVREGIRYLLTAHHQDDQAETLLLRLARGSGVYGLAAMPAVRPLQGYEDTVTLVRPLLDVPKARLVAALAERSCDWSEDPSNTDEAFDRVKVRRLLANPPLDGLRPDRLAATAARLRRSRDALEFYEREWLAAATSASEEGNISLSLPAMEGVPEEILLRGVASICRYVSGQEYVPRMEKLERLVCALQAPDFSGATLYGARFVPLGRQGLLACRELAAMSPRMEISDGATFDNRFVIAATGETAGLSVGPLTQAGWEQAVQQWPDIRQTGLPMAANLSLPAIFAGNRLRAIPHLGYNDGTHVGIKLSRKGLPWPKE
jgi:tRNA(Ile)-lysidine synthase